MGLVELHMLHGFASELQHMVFAQMNPSEACQLPMQAIHVRNPNSLHERPSAKGCSQDDHIRRLKHKQELHCPRECEHTRAVVALLQDVEASLRCHLRHLQTEQIPKYQQPKWGRLIEWLADNSNGHNKQHDEDKFFHLSNQTSGYLLRPRAAFARRQSSRESRPASAESVYVD